MFKTASIRRTFGIAAIAVMLLAVLSLAIASPVQAGEVITGEPEATLPAGETVDDDLFIAGQIVRVDGTVNGDVFAAGQEVIVTGTINGNLFVGSQLFTNSGTIDGSVYSGAYVVKLVAANIADSFYGAGFSVTIDEESQVGRSAYMAGYQGILDGQVSRDANFSGAAFRLKGDVGRNLVIRINETDQVAADQYRTWTPVPLESEILTPGYEKAEDATVGGEVDYQVVQMNTGRNAIPDTGSMVAFSAAAAAVRHIGEFLALLLVGVVLVLVWPKQVETVEAEMTANPWRSLGIGFLAAIAMPFAVLLAVGLIIGIGLLLGLITLGKLAPVVIGAGLLALGLTVAAFSFAALYVGKSIFGHLVGDRLFGALNFSIEDPRWNAVLALLTGLVIYAVIRIIPILGWLVAAVVVCVGLGAIIAAIWMKPKAAPKKATKAAK